MKFQLADLARRAARWLGGREPLVLLGILLLIGGIWAFAEIADEVIEGDTSDLDAPSAPGPAAGRRQPDRTDRTPLGPEIGRDATALGGVGWLVFFTCVVAGYMWLDRKYRMMLFLLAATLSGFMVSSVLSVARSAAPGQTSFRTFRTSTPAVFPAAIRCCQRSCT